MSARSFRAGNTLAYCWAHVRRDFLGIQIKYPSHRALVNWAQTWLNLIADLFFPNALRICRQAAW